MPQIKHYKIENSEARFFRHRSGVVWHDEHAAWPKHMGVVNRARILYQHYKYRTPQQVQRRLNTRQDSRSRGFEGWEHAMSKDWYDKLINSQDLYYDDRTTEYQIDQLRLPNHLESLPTRTLKKVMHGMGIWS